MTFVVAGLVLGVASSLHCAAMCGPLVLAFKRYAPGWHHAVTYHLARIAVYAALGGIAGALGRVASLGGMSGALSVAVGAMLVASAAASVGSGRPGFGRAFGAGAIARPVARLLASCRTSLVDYPIAGSALAGTLNGLVPCGVLWAALAAASAAPTPLVAAGAMTAYGVGTCPPLVAIWSMSPAARPWARRWRLVTPAMVAIAGLLLVGRGIGGYTNSTDALDSPGQRAGAHEGH